MASDRRERGRRGVHLRPVAADPVGEPARAGAARALARRDARPPRLGLFLGSGGRAPDPVRGALRGESDGHPARLSDRQGRAPRPRGPRPQPRAGPARGHRARRHRAPRGDGQARTLGGELPRPHRARARRDDGPRGRQGPVRERRRSSHDGLRAAGGAARAAELGPRAPRRSRERVGPDPRARGRRRRPVRGGEARPARRLHLHRFDRCGEGRLRRTERDPAT